MPIYEFYCSRCHRVFNFLSRTVDTRKRPACPRCGKPRIERRVSRFAVSSARPEPAGGAAPAAVDERRMERAVETLAREAEQAGEDDPRALARLMRRFSRESGVGLGEGMEEAIRRMEAGEDPDAIEAEMGDLLESDDPDAPAPVARRAAGRRPARPPSVDDRIYEL